MDTPRLLRVVLLEDDAADADLVLWELRHAGYRVEARRVEDEAGLAAALGPEVDLVLADYELPRYDGMRALAYRNARKLDTPFIIVSGAIGEELAVSAMLQGAFAYVMKEHLKSLPPIVAQALDKVAAERESRRAHAELEAEIELRKLIEDSTLAGLVLSDSELKIQHVNATFCRLVGLPREALIGARPPFDFEVLEPTSPPSPWLERGASPGVEAQVRRPNGERVDIVLSSARMVGSDGRELGFLRTVHDVTERKRMQAQILQAQKMESIGVLAGGVAHDFNNLLTAIIGTNELVLGTLPPDDPRRSELATVTLAANRAAALTRQLLIFSRKEVARPVVLDLNRVIQDVHKMLRRILGEDVTIELALSRGPALVRVDPGQLEQVVMNLAVNARDAMPSGGRLVICTEVVESASPPTPDCPPSPNGRWVRLRVEDSGVGIPPEILSRIFEPFFTTKPKGQGTGLGLSIVYGIVREAAGTIEVASAIGRGTTFSVHLPNAEAHPPETAAVPRGSCKGKERVLLVEDEDLVRSVEANMLTSLGFQVVAVASARAALEVLSTGREPQFALLVTDVVMPGMGGIELAKEVATRWPWMKVALVSGYLHHRALEDLGGLRDNLISKPLSTEELGARLREILDRAS